jgi:hypothetical protein
MSVMELANCSRAIINGSMNLEPRGRIHLNFFVRRCTGDSIPGTDIRLDGYLETSIEDIDGFGINSSYLHTPQAPATRPLRAAEHQPDQQRPIPTRQPSPVTQHPWVRPMQLSR